MILSVSRRTDIPALYSEWLFNRIKEGFVYVRNPYNIKQISKIDITPRVVDCIVFITKDPLPLVKRLEELDRYNYCFEVTLTPYGRDIEGNLRDKGDILNTFIELSKLIGKERMVLRYDPIILTDKYTIEFHKKSFERLMGRLQGYTERVIISFLDYYKKTERNMEAICLKKPTDNNVYELASAFGKAGANNNLSIQTCAESFDLTDFNINKGKCVDKEFIEKITGYPLKKLKQDANRKGCLCDEAIDIGQYDSCTNGCLYCYANSNPQLARQNRLTHIETSPILLGDFDANMVKERKVNSFKLEEEQFEF